MKTTKRLSRYVAAREEAERFAIERDNHFRTLLAVASRVVGVVGNNYLANSYNPVEIQESLDKAIEAKQNMLAAANEADTQAPACRKSFIKARGRAETIESQEGKRREISPALRNQILMSGKVERVMDENQEFDNNAKRVVASNLTAAYFATVEKQTRHVNPDGPERMEIYNQIKRVYSDFLSMLEPY